MYQIPPRWYAARAIVVAPAARPFTTLAKEAVQSDLTQLLTKHQLDHVTVECAEGLPEQSPGGKYRTVIPLR